MLTSSNERPHQCKLCDKAFASKNSLKTHLYSHTGDHPFVCEICKKGFTTTSNLAIHQRYHSGERPYPCSACEKRFFSKGDLQKHEKRHIRRFSKILKLNDSGEGTSGKSFSSSSNLFTGDPLLCPICNHKATSSHDLLIHIQRMHGKDGNVESPSPSELQETVDGVKKEKDGNKGHLSTQSRQRRPRCEFCNKTFSTKLILKVHLRIHTGERPYVCDTCGKGFSRRSYLVVHKRFHSGERPYPCSACYKRFTTSGDLLRHEKLHTWVLKSETPS